MNGLSPVPSGKPNATTGTPLSATRPSRSAQGRAVHNGLSFGRMISVSSRWIAVRYAAKDAAARTGLRARLARRTTAPSIANTGTTSQADAVSERWRGGTVPAAPPRRVAWTSISRSTGRIPRRTSINAGAAISRRTIVTRITVRSTRPRHASGHHWATSTANAG